MDAYFTKGTETYTTPAIDGTTYDITKKDWKYVAVKSGTTPAAGTTTLTTQETALKALIPATATTQADLEKIFKDNLATNKTTIEAYFTAAGKDTYDIPIGTKTYRVTKTLDATDKTGKTFTYPITDVTTATK